MKLPHRRHFLHLAAGAVALPAVSPIAMAQTYPSRPVRLIVTGAAGGSPDIIARLIGQWLSERLGQPVIVDNRTGAGGNIGTEIGVRAPPDGYTLLMALSSNAINAAVYEKLPFNFIRDTAPVASIAGIPLIMEVNPSVPVKTVPEFIAYAKANPGKINMASGGSASPTRVAGELFKMMAGAAFCPAVRPPHGALSRRSDTEQISWGKFSRLPCTVAESTLRVLDGYGLRGKWPARPTLAPCTRFLSVDSHFGPRSLDPPRRQPLRCR